MENLKPQDVFMAFFDDETLPFVGICMRTWRPCFVRRGGERFLPRMKKGVSLPKGLCTHNDCCLDTFCPLNHTPKNYLKAVLTPDEQKWFKENWLDIVDQCKVAYAKDMSKHYTTISLKPKQKPEGQAK